MTRSQPEASRPITPNNGGGASGRPSGRCAHNILLCTAHRGAAGRWCQRTGGETTTLLRRAPALAGGLRPPPGSVILAAVTVRLSRAGARARQRRSLVAGSAPGRGGDAQFFPGSQGAVAVAEAAGERVVGPWCAVVPGQGDELWAAGLDLVQHVLGVAFADRLPGRVGVRDDCLRTSGVLARWTGRCSPPTTALMGTSRTRSVMPRICSMRGWPQPLIRTRPKPATLITSACSVTGACSQRGWLPAGCVPGGARLQS